MMKKGNISISIFQIINMIKNGTGGDLRKGRLYVAHFEESGTGSWIELNEKAQDLIPLTR